MGFLAVLVAAAGAYAFGALWYIQLGPRWVKAAELSVDAQGKPVGGSPLPFLIGAVALIIVAGMMRHMFLMSGLDTVLKGLMGGFGLGAFVVTPWLVMNYAYAMRSRALMLIDGGYAVIGSTIMGVILSLFL